MQDIYKHLDPSYHYDTELLQNLDPKYIEEFENKLRKSGNYDLVKDNFIINKETNSILYILDKVPLEEMADLDEEKKWFYPMCNKDEITKIFFPQNSYDYFLKYKAEEIIDDTRLHRVYTKIRKRHKENWNFSTYSDSPIFEEYLLTLPNKFYDKCISIPHGIIHANETNAFCFKTPAGNAIAITFALKYFLYYMNIFGFADFWKISEDDKFMAFVIATRTMLGKESLDFEIDSRGELPLNIHEFIDYQTNNELKFVIGHEYAHHYLNHLSQSKLKVLQLNKKNSISVRIYPQRHSLEFEADYNAVINPTDKKEKEALATGAFNFFLWLDLYQLVEEFIFPPMSSFTTHPKPLDRLWALRNRLDKSIGPNEKELREAVNSYTKFKNDLINEFLPYNIEMIEEYGSLYLPNYKKRDEIKQDRIDF